MSKKILFVIAESRYFFSHRLKIAKAAIKAGHQVAVACKLSDEKDKQRFDKENIEVFPLPYFSRSKIFLWSEIQMVFALYKIYSFYEPHLVHQVAMKPIIYGSFVSWLMTWARKLGLSSITPPKTLNAFGGLGHLFTSSDWAVLWRRRLVVWVLNRLLNMQGPYLMLQNKDDLETLHEEGCHTPETTEIIPGNGLDIEKFKPQPMPGHPPVILGLVSRLLWEKGIGDLVAAVKLLQDQGETIKVRIYGAPDPENPASIPEAMLEKWQESGFIEWCGPTDNVQEAYGQCHIAVLPSYREGLPQSLLEAAACERPIVATNVPGCREAVQEEETGILVPPHQPIMLAEALKRLIKDPELRVAMGIKGRKHVEKNFNLPLIHEKILKLYNSILD